MRPKVAAVILLLAFGVLGIAIFISRTLQHESNGEANGNLPVAKTPANVPAEKEIPVASALPATNDIAAAAVPPVIQETNQAEYVQQRLAELMELGMNDDSNSLNTIWSELSNPDKEIREGALEAVVQFGDRSVTPRLRELAAQTEDTDEKAKILAAADQLELPPLIDLSRAPQTNVPQ